MKPLKEWDNLNRGYRFGEPTFYSSFHLGLDLICNAGTPLYAPFDGYSLYNPFTEGGNVIDFTYNNYVMRFMHLQEVIKTGFVKQGDLIAYTGNTGTYTTDEHLHVDISKDKVDIYNHDNFIDPETFDWGNEQEDFMTEEQIQEMTKRLRHDILGQDEDAQTTQGDMDYIKSNKQDKYVLSNWTGDRTKEAYDTYIMRKTSCNESSEKARADNLQVELGNTLTRTENEIAELKKQLKDNNNLLEDNKEQLSEAQTKLSNCGKSEIVEVEKDYTVGELLTKILNKLFK